MPEQPRSRDCIVLVKGETLPVAVSEDLARDGWSGGQVTQWDYSPRGDILVTRSDGLGSGFLLWGSDEDSDQHTSMTRNQPYYRYAVLGVDGWHILTRTFEVFTYASRVSGGPLTRIDYHASDRLTVSLRGYFTNEDEWTLSGDPRAPNTFFVANVSQAPSVITNFYLGIQVSL